MKPAPPETTALGLFAANAAIRETQPDHGLGVINVATIDDYRPPHQMFDARHVELPELVPFCNQDNRVRTRGDLIRVLQILHGGQQRPRPLDRGGGVSADFSPRGKQDLGDVYGRGPAPIVPVWLE